MFEFFAVALLISFMITGATAMNTIAAFAMVLLPPIAYVVIKKRRIADRLTEKERQLEEALRRAEAANEAKTRFLANMSHELRTPLNAVIGFSETLQHEPWGPLGDPRYREYASHVHSAGRHLLEIVNDVLDMAKVEAGKTELHEEEIDITSLFEECRRILRPQSEDEGARLRVEVDDRHTVRVDVLRLKQALINILTNAVRHTPPGGHIVVRCARSHAGVLAIQIRDTGEGIAPQDLEKVLQPFEQTPRENSRTGGTGLGLPIAKALVELHGGTLNIDSVLGQGTTVSIELPASRVVSGSSARSFEDKSLPASKVA